MKPEDQAAFDRLVRYHCDYWDFTTTEVNYMRDAWEAALAHRNAQIESMTTETIEQARIIGMSAERELRLIAVNQQMLEVLKAVQNRVRPKTELREKIDAAIAAAEASGAK